MLVKTLTGKTFAVSALPVNATLAALKEHIEVQVGVCMGCRRARETVLLSLLLHAPNISYIHMLQYKHICKKRP